MPFIMQFPLDPGIQIGQKEYCQCRASLAKHLHALARANLKQNSDLLAVPRVVEAKSSSKWPSRGLSCGTPDPDRLACLGIRGK